MMKHSMGSIGKKVVELEMEGSVLKEEVLLIKERVKLIEELKYSRLEARSIQQSQDRIQQALEALLKSQESKAGTGTGSTVESLITKCFKKLREDIDLISKEVSKISNRQTDFQDKVDRSIFSMQLKLKEIDTRLAVLTSKPVEGSGFPQQLAEADIDKLLLYLEAESAQFDQNFKLLECQCLEKEQRLAMEIKRLETSTEEKHFGTMDAQKGSKTIQAKQGGLTANREVEKEKKLKDLSSSKMEFFDGMESPLTNKNLRTYEEDSFLLKELEKSPGDNADEKKLVGRRVPKLERICLEREELDYNLSKTPDHQNSKEKLGKLDIRNILINGNLKNDSSIINFNKKEHFEGPNQNNTTVSSFADSNRKRMKRKGNVRIHRTKTEDNRVNFIDSRILEMDEFNMTDNHQARLKFSSNRTDAVSNDAMRNGAKRASIFSDIIHLKRKDLSLRTDPRVFQEGGVSGLSEELMYRPGFASNRVRRFEIGGDRQFSLNNNK